MGDSLSYLDNLLTEIVDPARLLLRSRMERPRNKRGIVHVFSHEVS